MARIVSPGLLNQGVEVVFDTTAFTVKLNIAGNLSADGVTLQALYSFAKEEWRIDDALIKFPFPFVAITGEQFEVVNGWDFADVATKNLIRDGGWALRNAAGDTLEEYMNITSLGLFNDPNNDRAYYLQEAAGVPLDIVSTGEVNQAIQIFSAATLENFNYKAFFKIYLREQGKVYGFYDLIEEQNIDQLTFRKFALPLVNSVDLKISANDTTISTTAPYTGMSISYYTTPQIRNIGGTDYNFSVIINGNSATAEQIYEYVQYQLRQPTDINAEAATTRGDTAQELLQFVGDNLITQLTTDGGVFIDNFAPADTNRLEFTDDTGTSRVFPFVAAGNIIFNDNLRSDANAKYFIFFTNDDAATTPTGKDFGTADAVVINDSDGFPLSGTVSGQESIGFDYDYDGNIQRGAGSEGTNVPFTAVSLGLNSAQYVVTTGTISRSTANVINFVAALERNYIV